MALVNFETFVVLKVLDNFVSMQKTADVSKIWKTVLGDLTFILNVAAKFSINFV